MTFTVKVSNLPGFSFEVEEDETILQAAERQGINLPVGCENGLCGTCKGHLDAGEIDYGGKEIFGLMPEEMDAGDMLFCSAYAKSDISVTHDELEPPDMVYKETVSVISSEKLSEYVWSLRLKTAKPWMFKAGQYINVISDDQTFPISISNSPGSEYLEIQIQVYQQTSHKIKLEKLITAETLNIEGPFGNAFLKPGSRPIIFIAGGSGFAPIKGMIEQLVKSGSKRQMYLFWGARKPEFLYSNEIVAKWDRILPNFHYIPVISEDTQNWDGKTGLVHKAVIDHFENLMSFEFYMAGPFPMVYAARDDLKIAGVNVRVMHGDALEFEGQ